jgi:hypothetical protein
MKAMKRKSLPDAGPIAEELPDVRAEAAKYFDDPKIWLESPNVYLAGKSPTEAIRKGDDAAVRDILRRIKYIGIS